MKASETLLLIEDDASLRTLLQEELALDGYRMLVAANSAEGAAMALVEAPDLVISDLRLPDGDGLDVLRKLQAEGQVVPFVIITAFGTGYRIGEGQAPRDVGLVRWRLNTGTVNTDTMIRDAAFDSDLRNIFDPSL